MKISYQNNVFNKSFNNFNAFLAIFNSFVDFKGLSAASVSVNKSTYQSRKSVFYFTSKSLSILEKIKF